MAHERRLHRPEHVPETGDPHRVDLVEDVEVKGGTDELEELSRSLRVISKNAKELLDKVEKLSPRDKLTGLYNVSYIRERLDDSAAQDAA